MTEPQLLVGGDAVLVIAADRPTVWLTDLSDPTTRDRAEAIAMLSGDIARHASRHDAGMRLIRDRLARLMLAEAGQCRPDEVVVDRSILGAPVVMTPAGWYLSLAARWPDSVIGVAPEPLGLDLERVEPALPPVLDVLTASECDWLADLPEADQPRGFARLWAGKESHAKLLGHPLTIDPTMVEALGDYVRSVHAVSPCWYREHGDLVIAVSTGGG